MPDTFNDVLEIYFDAEGEAQFVNPPPMPCHTIDVGALIDDKAEYFTDTIKTIRFLATLDWGKYAKNT